MAIEPLVFVVEDDRDIRETLVEALAFEGHRAEGALDGLDALERLRAMPAPPDLALVDLMMPRMNVRRGRVLAETGLPRHPLRRGRPRARGLTQSVKSPPPWW